MPWVRYDDNVRNHRKVQALDDATYRLWREAIEWCAQNLTDGVILTRQLGLTSIRATSGRARKLVERGLWHPAGTGCLSKKCPPSVNEGWIVHDYFDYQPTAAEVREEQAKARERKRKWLESRKNGGKNGVPDTVPNDEPNTGKNGNPIPSRPAPKGGVGTTSLPAPPAAFGDGAPAGGERKPNPNGAALCRTCANPIASPYHRNVCLKAVAQ